MIESPPLQKQTARQAELRILQVGKSWFSANAGGGSNRVFTALQRHLGTPAAKVHGVAVGPTSNEHLDAMGAHGVSSETSNLYDRWRKLRGHVQSVLPSFDANVITSHFALYAVPILDLVGEYPFVVHFHGPWAQESALEDESRLKVAVKAQIERSVYKRADKFIVLSNAFHNVLTEFYGVNPERIQIVPGGVDVDRFDIPGTKNDARKRLGLPVDRPIVFSVRRLVRRMGLENLIDAWTTVRNECPDALLLIAGKGPLANHLQARIVSHGLHDHVRMLGFVPDQDLPSLYRASDVSVIPTMGLEGFGLISVESLAAGTPVFATPVGGLPEILDGLSENLVMQDGSSRTIADTLIQALKGRVLLPSAEECADYARSRYSWKQVAEKTRSIYRSLL